MVTVTSCNWDPVVILIVISENEFGDVYGKGRNKKNITQMIKSRRTIHIDKKSVDQIKITKMIKSGKTIYIAK